MSVGFLKAFFMTIVFLLTSNGYEEPSGQTTHNWINDGIASDRCVESGVMDSH